MKGWVEGDRWLKNPNSSRGEESKHRFNEGGVAVGLLQTGVTTCP